MRLDVDARVATAAHVAAMREAIEAHEDTARAGLERIIRRYVRAAAASFERGRALTAAAPADLPEWRMPLAVDLLDEDTMQAELDARAKKLSDAAAGDTSRSVSAALGISFEQSNRLLHGVIASQSGSRITTAPEDLVRTMMTSLQKSYDDGDSIPRAARALRKAGYTHAKSYAERIARTELIGAVNAASLAQVQGATTIPYKLWMATNDNRTRPHHREADGQTVPIDSTFSVGGFRLEYPGDPNGPGEEVILCRCTMGYTDDLGYGSTKPAAAPNVATTTSAIDDVQATAESVISQVVKVPIKLKELPDSDTATARSFPDGSIGVHGDNSMKTNLNAVTHEAGHLIDRSILGTEDEWFTSSEAGAHIYRILRDSPTMRAVANDEMEILKGDTQTRNYFLNGREMFARAFHQHVAQVTKNPELMAEIRHLQNDDYLSFQVWQDDEFAPISEALRELFEAVTASAASRLSTDEGGSMAVTVETTDEVAVGANWSGIIAQEGVDTGDGRRIAEGALNWRELPLTLMSQLTSAHGGLDSGPAVVGGRINTIERSGNDIVATGSFDTGANGIETERLVREEVLRGISIDLLINDAEVIPPEDPADEIEAIFGGTLNVLDGTILGATIVPFPAFENASIAIVAGAAMRLGNIRKQAVTTPGDASTYTEHTVGTFYMPFAPFPTGDAEGDAPPADDNTDAADAIADITDAVNDHPGLSGKVVITIDGEDTTVNFPADAPDPEAAANAAVVTAAMKDPALAAALAHLARTLDRKKAA